MLLERQMRDQAMVRSVLDTLKAEKRASLTAPEAKRIADAYGIAVPQEELATSADEAAQLEAARGSIAALRQPLEGRSLLAMD